MHDCVASSVIINIIRENLFKRSRKSRVFVTDFTIASDCGRLLSPIQAESQIEGGAVQALGQTIYEDFIMDKGKTFNTTFLDYKMPMSLDIPNMELIDVVTDDPDVQVGPAIINHLG